MAKKKTNTLPGTKIDILPGLIPLLVPIDNVKPDPANPRVTQNLDALINSVRRFGIRKPIVVNQRDGIIEAGHQTRSALLKLGATHIPVVYADDERLDAVGFNIADNRTAEVVADWDGDALEKLLTELREEDDTMIIGFDGDALDKVMEEQDDDERGLVKPVELKEMDVRKVDRVWVLFGVKQDKYQEARTKIEELMNNKNIISCMTTESAVKNVHKNR